MSLYEYQVSQKISVQDPPFYALIMACFRKADTHNLEKLQRAFPGKWREFLARYSAPGGLLEGERHQNIQQVFEQTYGPSDDLEQSSKLEPLEDPDRYLEDYFEGDPEVPSSWDRYTDEELEDIAKES